MSDMALHIIKPTLNWPQADRTGNKLRSKTSSSKKFFEIFPENPKIHSAVVEYDPDHSNIWEYFTIGSLQNPNIIIISAFCET